MKKHRDFSRSASKEEWLYGVNPVLEALKAGRDIKSVYLSSGRHEKSFLIKEQAASRDVPVIMNEGGFFDANFPKGHQGVAARVRHRECLSIDGLLSMATVKKEPAFFLLLDGIEDPRNFGAILRVAEAGGVHGVVIQSHRSVGLGAEVSKSSAGAVEYVPVSVVSNIKHAISEMKKEGIAIIGTEADAGRPLWDADLTEPLAVVVGSEGKGVRRTVKEKCDMTVRLPMRGRINSLNVSVATGIMVFEVLRQRLNRCQPRQAKIS